MFIVRLEVGRLAVKDHTAPKLMQIMRKKTQMNILESHQQKAMSIPPAKEYFDGINQCIAKRAMPEKDKTQELIEKVEALINLLQEPSAIIITGNKAMAEYKKLHKRIKP